jgi:hypothetical protein
MNKILTLVAAASFVFGFALIALYKEQVAGIVYTIGMRVSRLSALMTFGNYIFSYPLP